MAFKANVDFLSKSFDVLELNYNLNRDVDAKGRPSSGIYGGSVDFTIESTDDTSVIEAMVNNPHKPLSGSIVVKKDEENQKMKELKFENAYIIKYTENFDINGEKPMTISLTVSGEKFTIGNATHENDWPGSK